ncbi:MAG: hypothetical protein RBR67_20860 [Desulfobacterium sp.]|jgi:hypothetical protein|nr:hypothetical protein [Desulfobacterium sp.]
MKSEPSPAAVSALKKVQKQFKHWRKTKTGRERIPDSLWQAAADVFHIGGHSLHKVAKALHLNHTHLTQYVEQHLPSSIQVEAEASAPEESPAFIEFELEPPSLVSECVIEMEDRTGAKMRMCLRGKTDPNILEICKSFWRCQA